MIKIKFEIKTQSNINKIRKKLKKLKKMARNSHFFTINMEKIKTFFPIFDTIN